MPLLSQLRPFLQGQTQRHRVVRQGDRGDGETPRHIQPLVFSGKKKAEPFPGNTEVVGGTDRFRHGIIHRHVGGKDIVICCHTGGKTLVRLIGMPPLLREIFRCQAVQLPPEENIAESSGHVPVGSLPGHAQLLAGGSDPRLGGADSRGDLPPGIECLAEGNPGRSVVRDGLPTHDCRQAIVPRNPVIGVEGELRQGGGPLLHVATQDIPGIFPRLVDVTVLLHGDLQSLVEGQVAVAGKGAGRRADEQQGNDNPFHVSSPSNAGGLQLSGFSSARRQPRRELISQISSARRRSSG